MSEPPFMTSFYENDGVPGAVKLTECSFAMMSAIIFVPEALGIGMYFLALSWKSNVLILVVSELKEN